MFRRKVNTLNEACISTLVLFQLTFHYQTRKCDENRTVLDDSHVENKELELLIGKKFKLEVWETCLKSMRPHEVASFTVHPEVRITILYIWCFLVSLIFINGQYLPLIFGHYNVFNHHCCHLKICLQYALIGCSCCFLSKYFNKFKV